MGYIKPSLWNRCVVTFHGIAKKSQKAEHLKISVFHLVWRVVATCRKRRKKQRLNCLRFGIDWTFWNFTEKKNPNDWKLRDMNLPE